MINTRIPLLMRMMHIFTLGLPTREELEQYKKTRRWGKVKREPVGTDVPEGSSDVGAAETVQADETPESC